MPLSRRAYLAATAGAGLTGSAAWLASNGGLGGGARVRVETLSAPGSSAGHQRVPVPGSPTLVDLFATWCAPCAEQMAALNAVHDEYGDRVAFVSVTNERFGGGLTGADVREWWVEHDGDWTLGHDPESRLMSELGASGLPYLALADANGEVRWRHGGPVDAATLRRELRRLLDD